MTSILLPQFPDISYEGWVMFEHVLPNGYRHVASVERPDADGNVCGKGEVYDLGQNAEGKFRLFRRGDGVLENSHVGRGEPLSDDDLAGFGLTRGQVQYEPDELCGDYSSLNRTTLLEV